MSESSIKSWGLWKRALCFPFFSWLLTEGEINVSNSSPLAGVPPQQGQKLPYDGDLWHLTHWADCSTNQLDSWVSFYSDWRLRFWKIMARKKRTRCTEFLEKRNKKKTGPCCAAVKFDLSFFGLLKEMLNKMLNKTFNTRKALWWYRTQKVQN